MTEAKWLGCTDPNQMLRFLRGKVSDRKFRLFACACCRLIWKDLTLKPVRMAIETAEQYADESETDQELERVHHKGISAFTRSLHKNAGKAVNDPAYATRMLRMGIAVNAAHAAPFKIKQLDGLSEDKLLKQFSPDRLRCIIGNPFRPVTTSPEWITPTVLALAQAAYDNRSLPAGTLDNARLAVLADCVEDSGCTAAELLGHLQMAGQHYRGCWALDASLGKK